MTTRTTLPRLAAAALAAAALSAPAAQARPADNDPAAAIQTTDRTVTTPARADDGGIDWAEAGFATAAVIAFAGAFGVVIRPRASRASA
jgi:hypothetical protein